MDLQIIRDYFSGKSDSAQTQEVQIYLSEHMDDPEMAAELERQFDACRRESDVSGEKALKSTRARLGLEHRPRYRVLWLSVAASVALILSVGISFQVGYRLHKSPEPVVWNEITVPFSETRELALPDGSLLTLNSGSRVTWPSRFTGPAREIFLDGEVLAEIARDSEVPFVIHSGDVDVRVHGTKFDLKAWRDASMLEVMLREGSVSMDIPSSEGKREVWLTPGDLAQYDRRAGELSVGKVPLDSYKCFVEGGAFSFINTPMRDIASELERSFGRRIVVTDPAIASRKFLAFFTNGESLEDILGMLARNGHLRIVYSGDDIYIYN